MLVRCDFRISEKYKTVTSAYLTLYHYCIRRIKYRNVIFEHSVADVVLFYCYDISAYESNIINLYNVRGRPIQFLWRSSPAHALTNIKIVINERLHKRPSVLMVYIRSFPIFFFRGFYLKCTYPRQLFAVVSVINIWILVFF